MNKTAQKADTSGGQIHPDCLPSLGGDVMLHKHDRMEHWKGIFKQPGLWKKLEYLFWRTLCPYPDQTKIGIWWYGASGRIAGYFHSKTCDRCNERRA